jgi:hypothetical protein
VTIGIVYKSSTYATTNTAASFTGAPTWTPAANSLILCFVCTTYSASPSDPSAVNGHGLSYSKLTLGASTLSTTHKLSAWVAKAGASPTSAAPVATVTSTNGTGALLIEFEITGHDNAGTALQAIVNALASNTGTGTAATVALAAAGHMRNRAITFVVQLSNAAPAATGSWTLSAGASGNFNTPATGAAALFDLASFNTAGAATTANVAWRMIGLEIKGAQTAFTSAGALAAEAAAIAGTATHTAAPGGGGGGPYVVTGSDNVGSSPSGSLGISATFVAGETVLLVVTTSAVDAGTGASINANDGVVGFEPVADWVGAGAAGGRLFKIDNVTAGTRTITAYSVYGITGLSYFRVTGLAAGPAQDWTNGGWEAAGSPGTLYGPVVSPTSQPAMLFAFAVQQNDWAPPVGDTANGFTDLGPLSNIAIQPTGAEHKRLTSTVDVQATFTYANTSYDFYPMTAAVFSEAAGGGGGATHTGSGALAAGSAAVAGTAANWRAHAASGALAAQSAALSGTAANWRAHPATGALLGRAAVLAGTATHRKTHSAVGALATQPAQIAGSAARVHRATGTLVALPALVSASASRHAGHVAAGALPAQAAHLSGAALRSRAHAASGALLAQPAQVFGLAQHDEEVAPVHFAAGALLAQPAQIAAPASHRATHAGSGALAAAAAQIAAAALHPHAASGALVASAAQIAGLAADVFASAGTLYAGPAVLTGSAVHSTRSAAKLGSGSLLAGPAQIGGSAQRIAIDVPVVPIVPIGPSSSVEKFDRLKVDHRVKRAALKASSAQIRGHAQRSRPPPPVIDNRLANEQRKTAALLALLLARSSGSRIATSDEEHP